MTTPTTPSSPPTPPTGYLLDNRASAAGARFAAFTALFDPATFRHLEALGIAPGWRCWEVGAGGTSVVRHLAERVGPDGYVLATDIEVSWAEAAAKGEQDAPPTPADPAATTPGAHAQVDVRRHDVASDPVPEGEFDLVHARLVLVHVPERDQALANMVAAVRPGGWVCLEDADPALQPLACLEETGPDQALANALRRGFRTLLAGRGVDLAYGRTLPRRLREAGLVDVGADAAFPVTRPECADLETATMALIRDQLVEGGVATDAEIDRHLANVAAGRLDLTQPPMISAWGRRRHTAPVK
jgi:SAM-dependent methyltransferase